MERGMTADQVVAALWRRKLLVGAIAGTVFAVGAAIVMLQPSLYEATVVVRVEPQRPAAEMVQPTLSERIEQRLLTVRQELLSRPVLQRAIEELSLYPEVVAKKGIDVAVVTLRKQLEVKVEGEAAFELTYQHEDPKVAAAVANRLPELFAEETAKLRLAQAARATALFADEIATLQKAVSGWEQRMAQFKIDHMGELPEQIETNMRSLERMSALVATKSEEMRVAESRRSELVRARLAADTEAGRLKAAEDALTRDLVAARTTWTEDHPEVRRLERELDDLTARRKVAEGREVAERNERIRAAALVEQIERDIAELQKKADTFQQRLDNTPRWTHELSVMQRDYEITRAKYQSVVSRKVEAELAQELEAKTAKTMFNVASPASAPPFPAKPDRVGGLAIAFLLALALSVLTAVVLELRDDSIRNSHELRQRLPVPLLAVVPQLGAKTERRVLLPERGLRPGPRTIN
ncbi:MAG: GumC family protein [Myxococcota bacterium]